MLVIPVLMDTMGVDTVLVAKEVQEEEEEGLAWEEEEVVGF
jgi:hypothetical protein